MRLDTRDNQHPFIWFHRFDKRNGYWAWGSVGKPFNRRKPSHWVVALWHLWNHGEWKK